MGRLCSGRLAFVSAAVIMVSGFVGCGGHSSGSTSFAPAKIILTPSNSVSMQLGSVLNFIATAQNSRNSNLNPSFYYQSTNTGVLTISPQGAACAGIWQQNYTVCVPQNVGLVQVTASALGAISAPTYVFVHAPIDNVSVTAIPVVPQPTPEPCLSMGQSETLQATAWSQNNNITASVGPFTWSSSVANVVTLTPIIDPSLNLPLNQVTATAGTPGMTQIYASASGVTSTAFVQAAPYNNLNYFLSCPVQNILLQVGGSNIQQTGITSFATSAGKAQPATAIVFDVLGNQLTKAPLTWSASNPGAVSAATTCSAQTCSLGAPAAGYGSVTASCTPPTCNVGFPFVPTALQTGGQVPNGSYFIPLPVYATTALSGEVIGKGIPVSTSVLATSADCQNQPSQDCTVSLYVVPTIKNATNAPVTLPTAPNSLLFDPPGDKAYAGSEFGAYAINPANIGGSTSPFTTLPSVTGTVLAVSNNGNNAIFADSFQIPNQVYVTTLTGTTPSSTALNITAAVAAGFTPDGLKSYILGCTPNSAIPCRTTTGTPAGNTLYINSPLQYVQTVPLSAPATTINFSPNGAFMYYGSNTTVPTLTAMNVCNNQVATYTDPTSGVVTPQVITVDAVPAFTAPLPALQTPNQVDEPRFVTMDAAGTVLDIVTAKVTTTSTIPANPPIPLPSCPQNITHTVQKYTVGQGVLQPIALFTSPDGSLAYIVSKDLSLVLVYNFITSSVTGIPIANNVTPVAASMTSDGLLIYIAGNDQMLHQISIPAGADIAQIPFPSLPNVTNPFCSNGASSPSCNLNLIAVKP